MGAKYIACGEPANASERQALRFLVDGLPEDYTVYGNPWLVERSGVVYELDAVVVAPHAIFVVEIKSYRGRIEGTDHDWYIPHPLRSPLKKNRLTAQILKAQLKRESYEAGKPWVQGLVFLSATTDVGVKGPASKDRLHTRKTILPALCDRHLIERLSHRRSFASTERSEAALLGLLKGGEEGPRPVRRVREYEILETLEHQENFSELLGRNELSGDKRRLRIYTLPPLGSDEERDRVSARARWESQVLGRLGGIDGILSVDPPFSDEAGIVLPFEHFPGITLTTWVEVYGPGRHKKAKADLKARTDLWIRIAGVLDAAHREGVVHRLLQPDVLLVEDRPDPQQVRVTGFDLAKQLSADTTVSLTRLDNERLVCAAPEVVARFSNAEPASDQFSLGALLALLLTGEHLFESTRQLMADRRLMLRVRDMAPRIPLRLDEAVTRMLELRPTDRFRTLEGAIAAVRTSREPASPEATSPAAKPPAPLDVDNLEAGTAIGPDYEILSRLGQGGMAVVYAARHLVSGRTRALKIARDNASAEEALRGEYTVLSGLDHPNLVRVIDLSKMIAGRLTLVMERVGGETLRQWLARQWEAGQAPDRHTQRRLAEDLLAGLDVLEQEGVTHKDLKPDNLLVGDEGLTVIDFSLAAMREDASYGGTALYRDAASRGWTHATDRFAAALCLFELYAGRHAFDGQVPEPGQAAAVSEEDIDPPSLATFFHKALDPVPEKRFSSAREMREALLVALGAPVEVAPVAPLGTADASTPLRTTALSRRAVNALGRCQVHTVGELLALSAAQVRAIHAIGTKTAAEVIALQEAFAQQGLEGVATPRQRIERSLVPELSDSPEPLERLPLSSAQQSALRRHGLTTVGSVAGATRGEILALAGIGRKSLAQVVEALHQFNSRSGTGGGTGGGAHTLDRLWELASRPLGDREREAVEQVVGLMGEPATQAEVAALLGTSQPQVSSDFTKGLQRLSMGDLADPITFLERSLESLGGVERLDALGERFEEEWPSGVVSGTGFVRLLLGLVPGRFHLVALEDDGALLVADSALERETLRAFAAQVLRLAEQWPPEDPEVARRTLAGLLPEFRRDHLSLGVRLCSAVGLTDMGHLFMPPVAARRGLKFVLDHVRDPLTLEELKRRVERVFGPHAPLPETDRLLEILHDLDCQVRGEHVMPGRSASVLAQPASIGDEPPPGPMTERSPEEVVRDMLREAARSRGFRMLVVPPERMVEVGPSVARALGATWLSFEAEFFEDHGADLPDLERAERFVAQRDALTEAAEETFDRLFAEHARDECPVVLGDTALWGLCDTLDLPRRLYDETISGQKGFWVLVVPGVILKRQPRFNEGSAMWHLEGATLPLLKPLPGA